MTIAADLGPGNLMRAFEKDGLEVLAFTLDAEPDLIRGLGSSLTRDECRRAENLVRERDRERFIVTRGRLRHLLAARLGVRPLDIELEYGPQGKPTLSRRMSGQDLRFSVSRSEGVAVIALSKFRDVGVDIEAVRRVPEADDIAALCFAPPEYDSYRALCEEEKPEGFLIRWTRMEAIAKALGCGLGRALPSDDRNLVVHTFVPQPGFIATIVQN